MLSLQSEKGKNDSAMVSVVHHATPFLARMKFGIVTSGRPSLQPTIQHRRVVGELTLPIIVDILEGSDRLACTPVVNSPDRVAAPVPRAVAEAAKAKEDVVP